MKTQVILVTGASSGIGKSTAHRLIKDGHKVYVAARRLAKMKDLEDAGATALEMDVTIDSNMNKAVEQIIKEQGRIDVLVNNAGYAIYGSVEETSIEDARRQFEVNIFGLARLTQLVLPHMRAQKSGKIINMSSMGGKMYTPMGAWYHATKHALEGWSDCLRLELKQFNINVVIIEPGGIKTEFDDVMYDSLKGNSGSGPYASLASKVKKGSDTMYNKLASKPEVIAKAVSEAVKSKRPKTRYRRGFMAKPGVFMRTFFGDRFWDFAVMRSI
ncbi:MAG: oxidoreductase [Salibacteraceae bacterium]